MKMSVVFVAAFCLSAIAAQSYSRPSTYSAPAYSAPSYPAPAYSTPVSSTRRTPSYSAPMHTAPAYNRIYKRSASSQAMFETPVSSDQTPISRIALTYMAPTFSAPTFLRNRAASVPAHSNLN